MAAAMIIAGGFDYLVNVFVGRQLAPTEFFVFVSVTALIQIMVQVTNVIRNVVAFYVAEATVRHEALQHVGSIFQRSWRWAWRWGLVGAGLFALTGPALARFLRIDTPWPLWAAAFALLLLFLRPVTDGTLQGTQRFYGLGSVQMLQSLLRLLFAVVLLGLGLQAAGAIVALPLGSSVALVLALVLLRPYLATTPPQESPIPVSWRYSIYTLIGLLAFALMVNADAIVVRRLFGDAVAEAYGPVVTLGKMNLFIPLGIGLVLFPKATQRHVAGRDSRPVLMLALLATLLPGLLLTVLYYLFSAEIVMIVFGPAYEDPGIILPLVGLATTLFAGINIWLNYALSLERRVFVFALATIVLVQIGAMVLTHSSLATIASIMIVAGLAGHIAGAATTLRRSDPGDSSGKPEPTLGSDQFRVDL